MDFKVGQKVAYPNHGVCAVEKIEEKQAAGSRLDFYTLRVLSDNSAIFVPKINAKIIGVRPIINASQCDHLKEFMAEDFVEATTDWKLRVRDYTSKIQSGDIFEVTDVLKQLTFLTSLKQLSFSEQRLLEKAKFLVVSEMAAVCAEPECKVEIFVDRLLAKAIEKHQTLKLKTVSVSG